jgi:diguanylate cyclase (GGDEF)-like protein/PAS domain S-box-containing protein
VSDDGKTREELVAEVQALRREVALLRRHEAEERRIVQTINSIVLRWDPEGRVMFLNEYGLEFFGYRPEEIVGRSVLGTIVPATETSGRDLHDMIADLLRRPDSYVSNENENMRQNGERVWITWRNHPVFDERGQLQEIISTGIDTTERKRAEEALRGSEERFRGLAVRDGLTGLYNTRYLHEALGELMTACACTGTCFSVIFMDLDRFKQVVDTHGHLNGSRAIQEVAATIDNTLRPPAFAVAYGGDEFVVVLPGSDTRQAMEKAEEIRMGVDQSEYLAAQGLSVRLSASFGVASYPDDAHDLESLLALADHALFGVKHRGKNAVASAGQQGAMHLAAHMDRRRGADASSRRRPT